MTFDGRAKQKLFQYADSQNFAYTLEAGQKNGGIFQAASDTAVKSKAIGKGSAVVAGSGTISLDIRIYEIKEIRDGTSVITSVALAVRGDRKDKLGSNRADHCNEVVSMPSCGHGSAQ